MRSFLNTIPIETPFAYQRQGYYNEHIPGTPIADGPSLLPFYSMPFDPIANATVYGWLKCINGDHAYDLGALPVIEKNNTWTVYHDGSDTGAIVPIGYYYVEVSYTVFPAGVNAIYDNYITRVDHAGATMEAEGCVLEALVKLGGGTISGKLFKTEPFFFAHARKMPKKIGDYKKNF